jgi:cysteine desulfurase
MSRKDTDHWDALPLFNIPLDRTRTGIHLLRPSDRGIGSGVSAGVPDPTSLRIHLPPPSMTGIYLDHAATTPMRPGVAAAMRQVEEEAWGNPSSPHQVGARARRALTEARARVAARLGYAPREIHFVRGGTEANNLAILGRFAHLRTSAPDDPLPPFGLSALEHSSVSAPASHLEGQGVEVVRLPFDAMGRPDRSRLRQCLERGPGLLSVQAVNSECGLALSVEEVLEASAAAGVPVHVDGAQALHMELPKPSGRPLLLSLSGHKFGGPRGIAILAVPSSVALAPLLHGGPQEFGLRPGTEDVAGAVGVAQALEETMEARAVRTGELETLRALLERRAMEATEGVRIVAREGPRSPHIVALGLPGVETEVLLGALDLEGVAASAGSACRSGSSEPGPAVRTFLGPDATTFGILRLSLGWNTTPAEVEEASGILHRVLRRLTRSTIAPSPSKEGSSR